ncbi:MAG: hypothetical protein JO102_01490 [Elusimicrobia bacterium]|nr:hypothetical protein [Elusimicrobiota bacterium]
MICAVCQTDNRDNAKTCRKCGADLNVEPLWRPTWKWHARTLAAIYIVLGVAYFAISSFLKKIPEPYRMRTVPKEVTPWIKNG